VIETLRAEVYIFTTGTLYKISSRALLPSPLRTGNFTVECPCPEPFRLLYEVLVGDPFRSLPSRLQKPILMRFNACHKPFPIADAKPASFTISRYLGCSNIRVGMGSVLSEATFIDLAKVLRIARRVKGICHGEAAASNCVQ
jgi:hypothetical protein